MGQFKCGVVLGYCSDAQDLHIFNDPNEIWMTTTSDAVVGRASITSRHPQCWYKCKST